MKPTRFRVRLRVLPIALLLVCGLWLGAEESQRTLAELAAAKHDYATALQYYSQIKDESGYGLVMLAWNNVDEAMKHFQIANDLKGMGLACCKARDYQTALQYFQTAGDYSGMGLAYLGLRNETAAQDSFTKANDWSGLGLLYLRKKQYAQAEYCFSQVQDYSGLALVAHKQGDYAKAMQFFQKANDVQGYGLVAMGMQNYRAAIKYFESINDYSNLGYAYLASGNHIKAYRCLVDANDFNGLGDYYSANHLFARAREMFARDNNPVKVVQSYRNDYLLPDRLQQAAAYGEKSLSSGIMTPEVLMELADVYYEMHYPDKSMALLDQAAKIQGYTSDAQLRKGRILFLMGCYPDARAAFLQVKPDDLSGDRVYVEAQASLKDVAVYERLARSHVQKRF